MPRLKRMVLAILAVAAGSCGGRAPGKTSFCQVKVDGANYDCRPATAKWGASANTGVFTFQVSDDVAPGGIFVTIRWTGELVPGHYLSSDPGANGSVATGEITTAQGFWSAESAGFGSYDLNLTAVSNAVDISKTSGMPGVADKAYSVSGTLTATLQNDKGLPAKTLAASF